MPANFINCMNCRQVAANPGRFLGQVWGEVLSELRSSVHPEDPHFGGGGKDAFVPQALPSCKSYCVVLLNNISDIGIVSTKCYSILFFKFSVTNVRNFFITGHI